MKVDVRIVALIVIVVCISSAVPILFFALRHKKCQEAEKKRKTKSAESPTEDMDDIPSTPDSSDNHCSSSSNQVAADNTNNQSPTGGGEGGGETASQYLKYIILPRNLSEYDTPVQGRIYHDRLCEDAKGAPSGYKYQKVKTESECKEAANYFEPMGYNQNPAWGDKPFNTDDYMSGCFVRDDKFEDFKINFNVRKTAGAVNYPQDRVICKLVRE